MFEEGCFSGSVDQKCGNVSEEIAEDCGGGFG
jgi:hypothetical protein